MKTPLFTLILTSLFLLLLASCASPPPLDYPNLTVQESELSASNWGKFFGKSAMYPIKMAKRNVDGCATIEYVITPQLQLTDIRVVKTNNPEFANAAIDSLKTWDTSKLPVNLLNAPVKTQTRFEFCLDKKEQLCSQRTPVFVCPGDDVVKITGSVIKRIRR